MGKIAIILSKSREVLCKKEKDTHLYKNYVDDFLKTCDEALNEIENGIII